MTDFADLGLRIRSEQADVASDRLDDLAASAGRAEKATDGLAASARRAEGAAGVMAVAVRQQDMALKAAQRSMGLTTTEGLNMGRQLSDVGVQLAMGMNPFMIAIQQGPQVFDIFQQAAIRSGTSVSAAMRATGAAVWTALGPLLPIIAAIAAGAALIGGAWALATRELSKGAGDVTREMGLTEAQMKRLKDEGVSTSITAGDAFKALGTTIKESLADAFGPQIDWIRERWTGFLDTATEWAGRALRFIVGGFTGAFAAIGTVWSDLPAVVGDAAVSAANIALRTIEGLINRSAAALNAFIVGVNATTGAKLGFLGSVSLGQIGNGNAGALASAGREAGSAFRTGFTQGAGAVDAFGARFRANAVRTAQARVREAAGDPGRTDRGTRDAAVVREQLGMPDGPNVGNYVSQIKAFVEPLKLVAEELALIDQQARSAAQGLAEAFGQQGRALGDLLTALSGYQSKLAEIDLAEREYRLSAAQADRERAFAQVQHYGDMASAAKGFFKEGSDGYRILEAAERGWRLFQFAMSVQAIAMGGAETAASVAQSATRGAASLAAGAAKMFEFLGPLGFPAVAAMLGLLAGLGLRGAGGSGSGGSASASVSTAQDQASQTQAATAREPVQVMVTADRDGLNAYVVDTAAGVAMPIAQEQAAGAGYQSFQASRRTIPAEQGRKARMRLGVR